MKILKLKNSPKKHKNSKITLKHSKSNVRRPQIKKFRKQSVVRIENFSKWNFQKYQKLKDYHKNTQKPKIKKNIKKSCKEASNKKRSENKLQLAFKNIKNG